MNDIYDHAPECDVAIWLERAIETDAPRWLGVPDDVACQCQKLRACEARLEDEWLGKYNAAEQRGYDAGFRNGVQAARDAASNQRSRFKVRDWDDAIDATLVAIDALRGES